MDYQSSGQIAKEGIMCNYSVKQLSDLAKISVRTLHYYDEIGLIKPSYRMANNYRLYDDNDALKLQQVLIYKEMGLSLDEIDKIINAKDFDIKSTLINHQKRLHDSIERTENLLSVISQTLKEIEGKEKMKEELYQWQSEERQKAHEEYLIEKYGEAMRDKINQSNKAFAKLNDEEKTNIMKKLETIETALVDNFKSGVKTNSRLLAPILDKHREWVAYTWNRPCPKEAYINLADIYSSHPDFVKRYETLATGFCDWFTAAIRKYANSPSY